MATLQDLRQNGKPQPVDMAAQFAAMKALIEQQAQVIADLKASKQQAASIKVFGLNEKNADGSYYKGTVGVKLGRHYTVLYPQQWIKLLELSADILQTIEDNKARLSWKE